MCLEVKLNDKQISYVNLKQSLLKMSRILGSFKAINSDQITLKRLSNEHQDTYLSTYQELSFDEKRASWLPVKWKPFVFDLFQLL